MRDRFETLLIENNLPYVVDSGKAGYFDNNLARSVRNLKTIERDLRNVGRAFVRGPEKKLLARFCIGYEKQIYADDFSFTTKKPWHKLLDVKHHANIKYLKMIEEKHDIFCKPTIHISTIHGSKGREADRVVVMNGMGERSLESFMFDQDSEYRNFYVAVTRTKRVLDIVYGENAITI